MSDMFYECEQFNCDLSKWDVSKVKNFRDMFYEATKFNQNIDNWKPKKSALRKEMFKDSPLEKNPPKWFNK